jgi:hypothetical protein
MNLNALLSIRVDAEPSADFTISDGILRLMRTCAIGLIVHRKTARHQDADVTGRWGGPPWDTQSAAAHPESTRLSPYGLEREIGQDPGVRADAGGGDRHFEMCHHLAPAEQ